MKEITCNYSKNSHVHNVCTPVQLWRLLEPQRKRNEDLRLVNPFSFHPDVVMHELRSLKHLFSFSLCLGGRSPPPQEPNVFPAVHQPKETNGWRISEGQCNLTKYVNTQ